ncbi:MAG: PAS domain-containing protein [Bryobacteraceae bacterium]
MDEFDATDWHSGLHRLLVEEADGILCIHDLDGRILYANSTAKVCLGALPGDFAGRGLHDRLAPESVPALGEYLKKLRAADAAGVVLRFSSDRNRVQWLCRGRRYERDGHAPMIVCHGVVLAANGTEDREEVSPLPAALDYLPDFVIVLTLDGRILDATPSLAQFAGIGREDLVGQSIFHFLECEAEECEVSVDPRLVSTAGSPVEWRWRHRDGSTRMIEAMTRSYQDSSGAGRIVVSARDVTEQRRFAQSLAESEERRRERQKMDAIQRLAGGLAHSFNNSLTVITGYSDILLRRVNPGDPAIHAIEQIRRAAGKLAALTRQLLTLSGRQVLRPEVVNPGRVIEEMREELERLAGVDITVDFAVSPVLRSVRVDTGQFRQAVGPLITFASGAMPDGGAITVDTTNAEPDEEEVLANPELAEGAWILLSVSYDGGGEITRPSTWLFEPFHAGQQGDGGLELSAVYGFVRQTGGCVSVRRGPGRGGAVRVFLPAYTGGAGAPAGSPGTVLVVEDEAPTRGVLRAMLEEHGYRVIEAGTGIEGLAILEERGDQIDLVLTDLVMPGMRGDEMIRKAKDRRPDVRVLYMSACAQNHDTGPAPFVAKPLSVEELVGSIRAILGAAGGGRAD